MTNLQVLNLSENQIKTVKNLQNCPLVKCILAQNQIENISDEMPMLQEMDLSGNNLRCVPALPQSIKILHISANRFNNIEDFIGL